jgi:hypothetical protein
MAVRPRPGYDVTQPLDGGYKLRPWDERMEEEYMSYKPRPIADEDFPRPRDGA